jgi:hypothetical protein
MEARAGEGGWIGGRRWDGLFFFGGAGLAAALAAIVVAWPAALVPLWWLWLLAADGPHLVATFSRTYFDAAERRRRGPLLWWSLLWLAVGPAAWAAGRALGSPRPMELLLLFASLWAFHHAVRQRWGIVALYARHDALAPRARRIDELALHGLAWGGYAAFLVGNPLSRRVLGLPAELPRAARLAVAALLAGCAAGFAAYLARAVWALAARRRARGAWFALAQLAVLGLALFAVGAREPLYGAPRDPEELFLAVALVSGLPHSLEYFGVVFAANRRRHGARGLLGSPGATYALCLAAAIGYVALVAARGISPGLSWIAPASATGRLILAVYWSAFFHHYYLDQKIWRPHADPTLRRELGLTG